MEQGKAGNVQKQKRGLETTNRILDAAADLFARNGYDGVPMRAIAQRAGIRESSVYNHFQSKADILETLFDAFIRCVPQTRPSDADLDRMLLMMGPEEIFKSILFHVGKSVSGRLSDTAMIINYEKFRNPRAAEMYREYVVREPAEYYERLIRKMMERQMVRPVDARAIAEQYNYVSIGLTKEYIMAQYGLADVHAVVGTMIRTLQFFCGLMENGTGKRDEKEEAPDA